MIILIDIMVLVLTIIQIAEYLDNPSVNPLTKRTIDPNGRLGKSLLKACSVLKDKDTVMKDVEDLRRKFLTNPNVNPETGRMITFNGILYRQLVALYGDPKGAAEEKLAEAKRKEAHRLKLEREFDQREADRVQAALNADLKKRAKRAEEKAEREEIRLKALADVEMRDVECDLIDAYEVVDELVGQMYRATYKILGKGTNIRTKVIAMYIHPDKVSKYDDGLSTRKTLIKRDFMERLFKEITNTNFYSTFEDVLVVARQVPIFCLDEVVRNIRTKS